MQKSFRFPSIVGLGVYTQPSAESCILRHAACFA